MRCQEKLPCSRARMDQARGLLGSLGRPGLKGWRRSSQGAWRSRTSIETKNGKREALTQKHPQGSCWVEDTVLADSPQLHAIYLSGRSQALREFIPESGQKWVCGPSDTGLPGINRPPVPSPGLPHVGSRMSVFLLHCSV